MKPLSQLDDLLARLAQAGRLPQRTYPDQMSKLDTLFAVYPQCSDKERAAIRAASQQSRELWRYTNHALQQFRATSEVKWLNSALTAIALNVDDMDPRDAWDFVAFLHELYLAAEKAGLDPTPHFQAAAQWAGERAAWLTSVLVEDNRAFYRIERALRSANSLKRSELYAAMDELGDRFWQTTDENRDGLRFSYRLWTKPAFSKTLNTYMGHLEKLLKSEHDVRWLRRGLAVAAVDEGRYDSGSLRIALAKLYRTAHDADLDPEPHFTAAAELCRPRARSYLLQILDAKRRAEFLKRA